MNITYLMEDTELSGGQRVQLVHADALIARGHRVRIVTKGLPVTWRRSRAEWVYVDHFSEYDAREDDFVIGTAHHLGGEFGVYPSPRSGGGSLVTPRGCCPTSLHVHRLSDHSARCNQRSSRLRARIDS